MIQKVLTDSGFDVSVMAADVLTAKRGSTAATRVMGTMLTPKNSLPMKLRVNLSEQGENVLVSVEYVDRIGPAAIKLGTSGKYRSAFEDVVNELQTALTTSYS